MFAQTVCKEIETKGKNLVNVFIRTVYKENSKENEGKNSSEYVCADCIQRIQTKEIKLVKIGALCTKKFKQRKKNL